MNLLTCIIISEPWAVNLLFIILFAALLVRVPNKLQVRTSVALHVKRKQRIQDHVVVKI